MLFAMSSQEVAKRSYEAVSGYESSIATTTMVLKNSRGETNKREMEFKRLEGKNGDKSLINFLYPKDLKDTKLLSFEKIGEDDKQWLYLPALKRVKRISSRNKSGSFMASEFSYEDIASQNYKNYRYEGEAEKISVDGKKFYKVVRTPVDKNSGYSKQIVLVDRETFLVTSGEFFDKQERLLKKIFFREYRKIDGVYRVKIIEIENVQNGKSTTLIWDKEQIKVGLMEKEFKKRSLK